MEAEKFRGTLERALAEADGDARIGPLICATRMRLRFIFPDVGLELNVTTSADDERLSWSFGAVDWEPKLTLEMSSDVADRYLLGRESLAIGIARGQVRVRGDSRAALHYLPATRLLGGPYRHAVDAAVASA